MAFNLRNRSFLKELDFTPNEWRFLLRLAAQLKAAKYAGTEAPRLTGKNIALIFEKTSTRTRCAFEVAAHDQGAHAGKFGNHCISERELVKAGLRIVADIFERKNGDALALTIAETGCRRIVHWAVGS